MVRPETLEEAKKKWPKLKIVNKDTSKFMKLIGWFLKTLHITPDFENYITAIHYTIYWPGGVVCSEATLIHELKHVEQYHKYKILHDIAYLLWPLLSIFSLLAFLAFINIWHLMWLLCLLFWIPIPWTLRGVIEAQAYGAELLYQMKHMGTAWVDRKIERLAEKAFSGHAYYFMMRKKWAIQLLHKYIYIDILETTIAKKREEGD